ncbi:protein-L-isoaspartate O-methyltransferase family protein [Novosphingobium sp. B 225]|uniref:protein-L-isoaspartate O-methyltransferase family protein n=1 Tax=Novosphingobium sp. B 225 TaxID=1961849 RepID=UPI0020CBD70F|nr:protein-L-isoaspartate O-methyltransferase [Novosphingobium sp. B 225]
MTAVAETTIDFAKARRAMIDSQLRVSGVNADWVLNAMARVPREDHVPADVRAHAYIDRAIPLGEGRALAAPLVYGLILSEAAPTPQDKVLLVSGSGQYLAALLSGLAGSVDVVSAADGAAYAGRGGYSLVLIDGAIEQLPDGLAGALDEGGRIVTGLADRGVTRLATGRKVAGSVALQPLTDVGIPVLSEFAAPKRWSF